MPEDICFRRGVYFATIKIIMVQYKTSYDQQKQTINLATVELQAYIR